MNVFGNNLSEDSFEIEKRKKGESDDSDKSESSSESEEDEQIFILPGDARYEKTSDSEEDSGEEYVGNGDSQGVNR